MMDPIFQFIGELIRALLVDEASSHVRNLVVRLFNNRRSRGRPHANWRQQVRNRVRLVHKIHTGHEEKP